MEYNLILQIVLVTLIIYWLLLAYLFSHRGIIEAVKWCRGIAAVLFIGSLLVLAYRKHTYRYHSLKHHKILLNQILPYLR
jgi:hypothetical protein